MPLFMEFSSFFSLCLNLGGVGKNALTIQLLQHTFVLNLDCILSFVYYFVVEYICLFFLIIIVTPFFLNN